MDGRFTKLYYSGDANGEYWEPEQIAKRFRRRESAVVKRINNVLDYCSGWKERRITYDQFVANGNKNRGKIPCLDK
jgi:hypothetical protein